MKKEACILIFFILAILGTILIFTENGLGIVLAGASLAVLGLLEGLGKSFRSGLIWMGVGGLLIGACAITGSPFLGVAGGIAFVASFYKLLKAPDPRKTASPSVPQPDHPGPVSPSAQKNCTHCGAKVQSGDLYCMECGHKVE